METKKRKGTRRVWADHKWNKFVLESPQNQKTLRLGLACPQSKKDVTK
jgi:hypothetical protein